MAKYDPDNWQNPYAIDALHYAGRLISFAQKQFFSIRIDRECNPVLIRTIGCTLIFKNVTIYYNMHWSDNKLYSTYVYFL